MTNQVEDDPDRDLLKIELAHVLWYLQRGKHIDDPDALHAAWRDEHIEATHFANAVVGEMYRRGMLLDFFDKKLARFAPKDETEKV